MSAITCGRCGAPVDITYVPFGQSSVQCADCREKMRTPEGRAMLQAMQVPRTATQIDGAPWWECSRAQVIVQYADFAQLEAELPLVEPLGWRVAQTDTTDGHINIGRILTLGVASVLTPLHAKGTVTVTWEHTTQESTGPAASLRTLKQLRDEDLITEAEYTAKRAEILARI